MRRSTRLLAGCLWLSLFAGAQAPAPAPPQAPKVTVIGAVRSPGSYDLPGPRSLLQIISRAGGLTDEAGNEILVIRTLKDGASETRTVSVEGLMVKGDPALDILLAPDDVISVPAAKTAVIYVYGRVRRPGPIESGRSQVPTLLEAIGRAGGLAERASRSKVLIRRVDVNGRRLEIKIDLRPILKRKRPDVPLRPGDVVTVGVAPI